MSFEEVAYLFNVPFPGMMELLVYVLFFLSLFILLRKTNPIFVLFMVLSPLFLNHLFGMNNISLSYQLFTFSLALYFIDRNKPLHSLLSTLFLSLLSPDSVIPVIFLFISRYLKQKDKLYLLFSIPLIIFIPFSIPSFDFFSYLFPLSAFLPFMLHYGILFFLVSIILSIFPSSIFFFTYEAGKHKIELNHLVFSIILISLFLSFLNPFYFSIIIIAIIAELRGERYFNERFYYFMMLFVAFILLYLLGGFDVVLGKEVVSHGACT